MQNKKSEEFEELEKPTFKVGDDSNINNPNDPNKFGAEFPFMYDQANRRIRKRPEMIPYTFAFGNDRLTSYFKIEADGTPVLVGDAIVYNDANVGGLALRAGATTPPVTQWVDNLGANTGVYGLGFAVNDEANGTIEIPHDYKEGTDIVFHIHWGANDAPSGTDYVKWQLTYFVDEEATESTTPPITTKVIETAYDTQYEHKRSDFPTITGTTFKAGEQINFNLKRITAAGDAYAGVAIAETIGFHYQCDTLGSRLITTK